MQSLTRIASVRHMMAKKKVSAFFITNLADIAWLSGYTGTTAYVILTQDGAVFITDGRYQTYCESILDPCWELVIVSTYGEYFRKAASEHRKITMQPSASLSYVDVFSEYSKVITDKNDILLNLRSIKTQDEIELLKNEYQLAADAFKKTLPNWTFGQQELEWAALLEYNMKLSGAEPSFDTIVASGVRGALPHGRASEKIIDVNDAITIDFGSKRLYNSDYTRVVYNGKDNDVLKIIDTVKTAMLKAIDAVKPGIKCAKLDKIARDHIENAGYGKYFNHSLGHGVGTEVHENPRISKFGNVKLQEGMVFTVEPGIYIPGKTGIRIEETVAVTANGCELLSKGLDEHVYKLI